MRIAVLQMTSGIDPAANTEVLADAIRDAAKGGAAMLFTPEMSGLLDRDFDRARTNIASEDADTVLSAVRRSAAHYKIWVHLGSLAIDAGRPDGRFVNRGYVIDDGGAIRARYDKMHLFDVDLPTGESWRESARYAPGDEPVALGTPLGLLGLSICYDLRFPALFAALTDGGATILSVPAAFTVPTGEAHWHVLLRARAIESGAYVVAAAQTGRHEDGRQTYGHSLVVDPWGSILLDAATMPGLSFCELDDDRVTDVRHRIPVTSHRRMISALPADQGLQTKK